MLEGITVLSQSTSVIHTPGIGIGSILIIAALITSIVVIFVDNISNRQYIIPSVIYLFVVIPILIALLKLTLKVEGPSYEIVNYKVIIDDSVKFNDFMKKYEIVDQDGIIYQIIEKGETAD